MASTPSQSWQPVSQPERYLWLDALRGVALFGVLIVNLETLFRISLFQHMLTFHTDPGWTNHFVDTLIAALLEFKAFDLFSVCFGIGLAMQAERAARHSVNPTRFLLRRLLVLLAFGLFHMVAIWNGDILTLYAVSGIMLLPLLWLRPLWLALCGCAAMALTAALPFGHWFPPEALLRMQAAAATVVYPNGHFVEILIFRLSETLYFIAPLLLATLPKVFGIMLLGAAAWRSGILFRPEIHRRLWGWLAAAAGLTAATLMALSLHLPFGEDILLALAYASLVLLWLSSARPTKLAGYFAAAGQMALTNYVMQSIVLGLIFYGYGLGLFGRLGSARALPIGLALYVCQIAASRYWLRWYRFGPLEWMWRSLTYGHWQRLRRE